VVPLANLIPVLVTGSTCRGKVVAAVERRLQKEDIKQSSSIKHKKKRKMKSVNDGFLSIKSSHSRISHLSNYKSQAKSHRNLHLARWAKSNCQDSQAVNISNTSLSPGIARTNIQNIGSNHRLCQRMPLLYVCTVVSNKSSKFVGFDDICRVSQWDCRYHYQDSFIATMRSKLRGRSRCEFDSFDSKLVFYLYLLSFRHYVCDTTLEPLTFSLRPTI
jgi:hypothetical protein